MNNDHLREFVLWLGDTALIGGHRMSEWSGRGPTLEEDIAMTNMALDLIGHAELLLAYAAELEGKGRTADDLVYKRPERKFSNALISELPNRDFAHTMVRQYFLAAFGDILYRLLIQSPDNRLAAIAEKIHKEVAYHLRHTRAWILRMGDGTDESHERCQTAIDAVWPYTGELFEWSELDYLLFEREMIPDLSEIHKLWEDMVCKDLSAAQLSAPKDVHMHFGGRDGIHTEAMGHILAEMQYLPRAFPDASW